MYNKKTWLSGEKITKEALNNIENGIYENCNDIANLSINESIDFTIKDSFNIKNSDEETDNSYFHFASIITNRAGVESREFWILINARYDKETKRFKRIDLDNFSFGWQMQASGTYPGEESFGDYINQGINLWKANGRKAYPVGSVDYDSVAEDIGVEIDGKWCEFGYMHGWNNHFMNDSYGGMTIGGSGFEVDGSGLHPYIRLSRNKYRGGSREFDDINDYEFGYAGIIENSFHGLAGKDANHKKGLFFGFKSDIEEIEPRTFVDEETSYFTIMEHPAGAEDVIEEWTEIYKFKPSGEIEITPNGKLYSFPCDVLSSTDFQFLFDYTIPINQDNAKLKYIDCKKNDGTHEIKKAEEIFTSFTEAGCNGYVSNEGEPYQSIIAFVENKNEMYDVVLKNTKSNVSIKMNHNGDIEINATNKALINGVDVNEKLVELNSKTNELQTSLEEFNITEEEYNSLLAIDTNELVFDGVIIPTPTPEPDVIYNVTYNPTEYSDATHFTVVMNRSDYIENSDIEFVMNIDNWEGPAKASMSIGGGVFAANTTALDGSFIGGSATAHLIINGDLVEGEGILSYSGKAFHLANESTYIKLAFSLTNIPAGQSISFDIINPTLPVNGNSVEILNMGGFFPKEGCTVTKK